MPRDEQRDDTSWQWHDSQWSSSTTPPAHPLDVPEAGDDRGGFSRALRSLMRWASRGS